MIKVFIPKSIDVRHRKELRNELTEKEYVYVKLAKLDEFVKDLYHCSKYPNNKII